LLKATFFVLRHFEKASLRRKEHEENT
jgi:hypothetical protein